MNNITIIDAAYQVLKDKKKPVSLVDLFKAARKLADKPAEYDIDEQVSFFTSLSVDGRFACLEGNNWTLKELLNVTQLMVQEDEDDDDVIYDEDGEEIKEKSEEDSDDSIDDNDDDENNKDFDSSENDDDDEGDF